MFANGILRRVAAQTSSARSLRRCHGLIYVAPLVLKKHTAQVSRLSPKVTNIKAQGGGRIATEPWVSTG